MRAAGRCILALGLAVGCAPHERGELVLAAQPGGPGGGGREAGVTVMPPPALAEGVFPCSDCHANLEPNPERRVLEMHEGVVLRHGDRERWCFDCHDPADRDQLRLAGGTPVPLAESQRLCGQCHGDKYRDWREGVHGKRIGSWNGEKRSLPCVSCHDAHAPRFQAVAPSPPPIRPDRLKVRR